MGFTPLRLELLSAWGIMASVIEIEIPNFEFDKGSFCPNKFKV